VIAAHHVAPRAELAISARPMKELRTLNGNLLAGVLAADNDQLTSIAFPIWVCAPGISTTIQCIKRCKRSQTSRAPICAPRRAFRRGGFPSRLPSSALANARRPPLRPAGVPLR